MSVAIRTGGRPAGRRHPVTVAVTVAITLAGFGIGPLTLAAAASPTVTTATGITATPVTAAPALPLTLPLELRLDTPAEAATHVAMLDTRLTVLDTALTTADAALVASDGKVDEPVRVTLADAATILRSLRGQRTHPGIPAATAAVVRLTAPVVAATTEFDVAAARAAELAAAAAEAARAAEQAAAAASAGGSDLAAIGEATLRSLPGNEGVRLAWNHAAIGNHLGGVFLDRGTEIMINERRLAATPERTASVVEHEMGHIYQARIMAANASALGGWNASYRAMKSRLDAVFAGNGLEKSADCIALQFGATWTAYNSECGGERQAAVDALLAGRMP